jgi:TonB family protein
MRFFLLAFAVLLGAGALIFPQSGRKQNVVKTEPPAAEAPSPKTEVVPSPQVTTERDEEYRCTSDGTLARVIDEPAEGEQVFTSKTVDVKANISARPRPEYTREARRTGVQGYVILKVVLRSSGELGTIRVVRRLPGGLTESAIRAACKIRFKPAIKDGKAVTQVIQVEYSFRLSDPIFGP